MRNIHCRIFYVAVFCMNMLSTVEASQILSEDFETGTLNSMLTIQTLGLNSSGSGIKSTSFFGSSGAFGFGRSNCLSNCFDSHTSSIFITLPSELFVEEISFKFAELFDNWGSFGRMYLDGVQVSSGNFQHLPANTHTPDAVYTEGTFQINASVTQVELKVVDITNLSEIFIDDLSVSVAAVPEPMSILLVGAGLVGFLTRKKII